MDQLGDILSVLLRSKKALFLLKLISTLMSYVARLIDCVTTIDNERMALNERRLGRTQEKNCISDFFRLAHSFHGRNVNGWLQCLDHGWRSGGHGCIDNAWTDTVDAYSVIGVVDGISTGHIDNGRF